MTEGAVERSTRPSGETVKAFCLRGSGRPLSKKFGCIPRACFPRESMHRACIQIFLERVAPRGSIAKLPERLEVAQAGRDVLRDDFSRRAVPFLRVAARRHAPTSARENPCHRACIQVLLERGWPPRGSMAELPERIEVAQAGRKVPP